MSDALLSATQNLVQAFNNNTRAFIYNTGQYTSPSHSNTGAYLIANGQTNQGSTGSAVGYGSGSGVGGRLVSVSVVQGATGYIRFYNSATVDVLQSQNLLAVIQDPGISVIQIGKQFTSGLVMQIEGQISANVTFSLG